MDGPGGSTTAFAGQAFANAGFFVLQVEDNGAAFTDDQREGPLFADGIYAGVSEIVGRGLVDPERIGLIGWSRTGYHAVYALGRHPQLFAAVSIADAVQPGYLQGFLMAMNSPPEDIAAMRRLAGMDAVSTLAEYFERGSLYRIGKSQAAVLLEADTGGVDEGGASILSLWETYAVLRSAGRPVDFLFTRNGVHSQVMPRERMASQGASVDWFRFWLQNYEDSDPAKSELYARWRSLRGQQSGAAPH